jgi:hypothetical protein
MAKFEVRFMRTTEVEPGISCALTLTPVFKYADPLAATASDLVHTRAPSKHSQV